MRSLLLLIGVFLATLSGILPSAADEVETRRLLVEVVLAEEAGEDERRDEAMALLEEQGEPVIGEMYEAWRVGRIVLHPVEGAEAPEVLMETNRVYANLLTGEEVVPTAALDKSRAGRKLRKVFKRMVDLLDLSSPDPAKRIQAAEKLGLSQNAEYLPDLKERLQKQNDPDVRDAFQEAVFISELANGSEEEQLAAVNGLGELKSYSSRDFIEKLMKEVEGGERTDKEQMTQAGQAALKKIDARQQMISRVNTLISGLSQGSVLLLVSYGLAITFGQMGVINMAHGEFIAIGGYTVYLVQKWFASSFGPDSVAFGWYFAAALPLAFIAAALVGVLLERGLIRFLYSRPLESLLATWGVSMVIQQLLRMKFGAANVSVSSPEWLSGSLQMAGLSLSFNRVFIIGFAVFVIVGTYLLMTRTNWGLHVRATMQNRRMASALGVPSSRVNMMTFAFGSGLAGLAGAFISQIGNVGPSVGQTYIVDSFMVVVVGGVGNLFGTAISAMGIGVLDQSLQPLFGPVMGKICVLFGIILFLQFRPGGIFPARSRSLDD